MARPTLTVCSGGQRGIEGRSFSVVPSVKTDIIVLGAGMVGTCTALHLAQRGHSVALVDRGAPGGETSYGNSGIIQREAVEPYAFPRDWASLAKAVFKRGTDVNYHFGALPFVLPHLARYWQACGPSHYPRIAAEFSRLIAHSTSENASLITEAGADDLVRRTGYRTVFRTAQAFDLAASRAANLSRQYGIHHAVQGSTALAQAEPALRQPLAQRLTQPLAHTLAGAIHWLDPWTVNDPGALVARYAALFTRNKGRFASGDAASLRQHAGGWRVMTQDGPLDARHAVVALGPWAETVTRPLGYRLPLFVKRGYHRHYAGPGAKLPTMPLLDAERGVVLAPMSRGLRITTGAEFARLGAPPTPVQLNKAEVAARELIDLPPAVETEPWMGNRPCTPDMKPVIGPAPRHPGLWFNFGHSHQGFTLGAVSGRLLADLLEGKTPLVDAAPYSAARFGR
jgi:D-amino-acid dehydrogenase